MRETDCDEREDWDGAVVSLYRGLAVALGVQTRGNQGEEVLLEQSREM